MLGHQSGGRCNDPGSSRCGSSGGPGRGTEGDILKRLKLLCVLTHNFPFPASTDMCLL